MSQPQLRALHHVQTRFLFTVDINRGNERRTYASLFKLGLLGWDPICKGHVVLTALGAQKLQENET